MNVWVQRSTLLLLAPLLVAQGRYTRAVTPRLPEAAGPRSGRAGSGPPLRLLITGDSAAAGVGVHDQRDALAGQLVAALQPHRDVRWRLVAQTGLTTADLLQRLAREPAGAFDTVVVAVGVNDVTGARRTFTWLSGQRALAELLQRRFGVTRVLLNAVPPMDEFVALPQPLRAVLGARARRFNAALAHAVQDWPGCELVSFQGARDAGALATDGFHPGAATYRRWGDQLARRILADPAPPGQ